MKRIFVVCVCLLLTGALVQAQELDGLYQQYLKAGERERLKTGNLIIQEAVRQNLIDSISPYKKYSEEMQALVHYAAASYAWEQNDLKAITPAAQKALELYIELDNVAMQGDCYHLMGAACQMQGDVYHAIDNFEKCYDADKRLNDPDRMSSSLNNLAGNYLSTNQAVEAEKVILRAIELEREMDRPEKLAIRLGMASDIYLKLGKPQAALPYITEAFELDSLGGRDMKMAIRLSQRASVYEALERYGEAKSSLLKAVAILASTRNIRSTAICYNQLGSLAQREGSRLQAEEFYGHAVRLSRQCNDRYAEAKATRGLAEAVKWKSPTQALSLLERHIELSDTIFSENTSKKLSQLQAKYNQAEKEHEVSLLKQRLEYKHMLSVLLCIFLTVVAALCVVFYVLLRKTKANLHRIESEKPSLTTAEGLEGADCPAQRVAIDLHLTKREMEVIQLCCKGMLDKEIGNVMNISERTVGTHKTNIFRKCKVNSTVELVNFAIQHRLLEEEQ